MPVIVKYLDGPKPVTPEMVLRWIGQRSGRITDNPATRQILGNFLTYWNQSYGFLQQEEFLRHFKLYVDQVELFNGLKDVCEEILRLYPPQAYLYVGIGRSPAPIIAYFENIGVRAVTIPLSNFRPRNAAWSITDCILAQQARILPAQQIALFQHFGNFFGMRPSRQRLLVIDYTQSAQSLLAAQEQLQQFFLGTPDTSTIEVHALALCRDSDEPMVRSVATSIAEPRNILLHPIDRYFHTNARQEFARRWHVIPIAPGLGLGTLRQRLVMQALSGQQFDDLAEFGSFPILDGGANVVRYTNDPQMIAAYDALRKELANAALITKH